MKQVKKAIEDSTPPMGFRTLVLEDGGRSMRADLVRSNPFPTMEECGRNGCLMCIHDSSKGKCWGSNVVYTIKCSRSPCTEQSAIPTYFGETCRSFYRRGSQHLALYKGKKENSFMWKHAKEKHCGIIGEKDFKMDSVERFRDALPRILTEAVLIQHNEVDKKTESLNSKMEYFVAEYVRPSFSKGPADQW